MTLKKFMIGAQGQRIKRSTTDISIKPLMLGIF